MKVEFIFENIVESNIFDNYCEFAKIPHKQNDCIVTVNNNFINNEKDILFMQSVLNDLKLTATIKEVTNERNN
jgi:hypothetical protein